MKVLIVDDDIFSIEGLKKGVAWESDGVTEVFQAVSAAAAKKIIKEEAIDILVCDIEMPNESGIELLEWIREQQIMIVVIFYSCHADFIYAQNAIKLQVFDYVLKPAPYSEIDIVLKKAVAECEKQQQQKKEKKSGGKKTLALKEKLIRAILDGTIPDTSSEIEKVAHMLGVDLNPNVVYYPILHDIKYWEEILKSWNRIDIEFSIKNIIREIFKMSDAGEVMALPVYAKYYLSILELEESDFNEEDICARCRHLNQVFKKLTGYGLNSYVGKGGQIDRLSGLVAELLEMSHRESSLEGAVITLHTFTEEKKTDYSELIEKCYQELLKNHRQQLSECVSILLNKIDKEEDYSFYRMVEIIQKYRQAVFAVLEIKNIDYRLIADNPVYHEMEKKASWGPVSLKKFIEYMNDTVFDMLNSIGNERDVVYEVKAYVERHLGEEIGRDDLAKIVYLNEDYLSRLFRKQEGVSLTQYITKKKIERAMNLLQSPEVSVTMAAEGIGISNFPYFSKLFKKETGMSPSEYKRMCQKSESK